jgi:hypothetical protein
VAEEEGLGCVLEAEEGCDVVFAGDVAEGIVGNFGGDVTEDNRRVGGCGVGGLRSRLRLR